MCIRDSYRYSALQQSVDAIYAAVFSCWFGVCICRLYIAVFCCCSFFRLFSCCFMQINVFIISVCMTCTYIYLFTWKSCSRLQWEIIKWNQSKEKTEYWVVHKKWILLPTLKLWRTPAAATMLHVVQERDWWPQLLWHRVALGNWQLRTDLFGGFWPCITLRSHGGTGVCWYWIGLE